MGDDLVIAKIRSSKGEFALGPDSLVTMKKAGVSDTVLAAMIQNSKK